MMENKRIIVTGGSGKAGQYIIKELINHDYQVLNLDMKLPDEHFCRTLIVDLNDLGQVHNALSLYRDNSRLPVAGIVHFAGIPAPFMFPNDVTFRNNVMSTYNILEAAANLGIPKLVLASSESSYGFCFASGIMKPMYFPVDEDHPQCPEDSYGLSKLVNEATANTFHRRTGMQIVSLRLSHIMDEAIYLRWKDTLVNHPERRLKNLWSYIDARDVAAVCRLALEKDGLGSTQLIVAADDTATVLPSRELIQTYFPDVTDIRSPLEGRSNLYSNAKLKQQLGWQQEHFWQDDL